VLDEACSAEYLARMAHQVFEKSELPRGELDRCSISSDPPGGRVQSQVPDPQLGGTFRGSPADERPEPGQQLGERERLGEVVVRAGVQPRDPVGNAVAGRQHEDRAPVPGISEPPAHLKAVEIGQHHVEDDGVVRVLRCEPECFLAVTGDVDGVALFLQAALEQSGHLHLVFHDQGAHGGKRRTRR
jgi:hypothetical protein